MTKFHCAGCRTERPFKDVSEYSRTMLQGQGEDGAPRNILLCRFCMPNGIVSIEKDFNKLPEHTQNFVSKWDYWDRKAGNIKMPPTRPVTKDKVLTYNEAAEYAGTSAKNIQNWAYRGYIEKVEVGNRPYIKVSTLDAYLDKRTSPENSDMAKRMEKVRAARGKSVGQPGEPKNLKELAHAIYTRRKVERKRQIDVAAELGLNQFDISTVELGRHTSPEKLTKVIDWMGYTEPTKNKLLKQKGLRTRVATPRNGAVRKTKAESNGTNGTTAAPELEPEKVFLSVRTPQRFDEATESALKLLASATGQTPADIIEVAVKTFIQTNIAAALKPLGIEVKL